MDEDLGGDKFKISNNLYLRLSDIAVKYHEDKETWRAIQEVMTVCDRYDKPYMVETLQDMLVHYEESGMHMSAKERGEHRTSILALCARALDEEYKYICTMRNTAKSEVRTAKLNVKTAYNYLDVIKGECFQERFDYYCDDLGMTASVAANRVGRIFKSTDRYKEELNKIKKLGEVLVEKEKAHDEWEDLFWRYKTKLDFLFSAGMSIAKNS